MTTSAAPAPRATAPSSEDRAFFGHPRGLAVLFFTEMWERFSYYGMRALLILFMTASVSAGGLGYDVGKAGIIYAMYTSLVYMLSLPGGWVADRFIGQRRAVLWGGIVIALGHVCLALPSEATFFAGLGLIVIGTGLLKPNVSTIVGDLYTPDDTRRDAGFSLYYMGINLGAFTAPLVCGWLAQHPTSRAMIASFGMRPESAWHWGFGAAAVGMTLGIIQYLAGQRRLGDAGLHPTPPPTPEAGASDRRLLVGGLAGVAVVAAAVAALVGGGVLSPSTETVGNLFAVLLLATTLAFFGWLFLAGDWTPDERKRLVLVAVLFTAATIFWSVFEQAGSTLNLFAERNTRREFLGMTVPAATLQSVNAMWIVALAPVLAWIWLRLGRRDPSSPAKFSLGLVLVGLGFLLLVPAATLSAAGQRVSPLWLVGTYLFHSLGELCISPVGMSAMTRLAPLRMAGLLMGVWFLSISVGNYIGGRTAGLYE